MTVPAAQRDEFVEQHAANLAQLVLNVSRVLVGVAARSLGAHEDITIPQFRALVLLAQRGPLRAADLAASLSISASRTTRLCDRLARKGLISREPVLSDRRGVVVQLEPRGHSLIEEVTERRLVEIEQIISAVPPEARAPMIAAFEHFSRAAGEVPETAWSKYWEL